MLDFSHELEVLATRPLHTQRDGENFTYFYQITQVQLLNRSDDPLSWKMTARERETDLNPGFEQFIVPILKDGLVVAGQVVMEDYANENIRGKGIPERLLLQWAEYTGLPLFSSVSANAPEHLKIYADEGRVKAATNVWNRLSTLIEGNAGFRVRYYQTSLYVLYPATYDELELLMLKVNYEIPG